jgi:3-isopropylmalate/(R)-2-methylmalate dehydratase small subunit
MVWEGRAHLFGDNVNTDYITPTDYMSGSMETIAEHVFEPIAPEFHEAFESGDIVVGGENFGSGSSRETAPKALKVKGVSAVVAESFARLFYRNGVAISLPVVTAPGVTDAVSDGDDVVVDFEAGVLRNETTGESVATEPISPALRSIYEAGGILEHYKRNPEPFTLE